jgi:drug/metabolite transporter (DMT)-like permease
MVLFDMTRAFVRRGKQVCLSGSVCKAGQTRANRRPSALLAGREGAEMQSYVLWALLGMAGYSLMTLFVKLAERSGSATTHMVLAVSTTIVSIFAILVVALRGELKPLLLELERPPLLWAIAGGIALTAARCSASWCWASRCRGPRWWA